MALLQIHTSIWNIILQRRKQKIVLSVRGTMSYIEQPFLNFKDQKTQHFKEKTHGLGKLLRKSTNLYGSL